jgi:hypothetical protein
VFERITLFDQTGGAALGTGWRSDGLDQRQHIPGTRRVLDSDRTPLLLLTFRVASPTQC